MLLICLIIKHYTYEIAFISLQKLLLCLCVSRVVFFRMYGR